MTFEEWWNKTAFTPIIRSAHDFAYEGWQACETQMAERIREAELKGWQDCLRNIRASIEGYPNAGGDIEVMADIEKLIQEARLEAAAEAYLAVEQYILKEIKEAEREGVSADAINIRLHIMAERQALETKP